MHVCPIALDEKVRYGITHVFEPMEQILGSPNTDGKLFDESEPKQILFLYAGVRW